MTQTPPATRALPQAQPPWTERTLLDLIATRYTRDSGNGPEWAFAEHVRSQAGFGTGERLRTIDALAIHLWPSKGHTLHGFEVKTSRSDWLTELRDPTKAQAFAKHCHGFWLVAPLEVVRDDLPKGWGHLAPDDHGGLQIRRRSIRWDGSQPEPLPVGTWAAFLRAAIRTTERRLGA